MASQRFTRIGVARRRSPRERKQQLVRLDFEDGSPLVTGTLSDVSATGARVAMMVPKHISQRFTMHFQDGVLPRRCRLVWKSMTGIGIEFMV